ncbi:MAG: putative rane protein involved in D-alanine export [Acidobacteria bacterium]|nr:putative rane protein involved in D-alanine export [Acidobacteriota bacterium]
MWFNSFSFLWFFPTVLLGYYAIPSWRARKLFLLGASYFFYACWNPPFVLLLVASSVFDYFVGRGIAASRDPLRRKLLVAASCISNFGVLVIFKYSGLIVSTWQTLAHHAGFAAPVMPSWIVHVLLPVGISFYTFHGVSYIVDVYRGRIEAERSLTDFALFVAFFPQLVAGPILRASYFVPQLESKRINTRRDWLIGGYLIILGLFQKVALADNLAPLANLIFDEPARFNTGEVWLGTYAFAFQIYFDFAGYSNVAIGCARLLGFAIPENFRMPYIAAGFREFWRRWHISLSTWLRDYLYLPLGGNRRGTAITIRNLFIVMSLGGLWHGAKWTFVAWGVLHGMYLAIEHLAQPLLNAIPDRVRNSRATRIIAAVVTFHFVCIAWVFFRAPTIHAALAMLTQMLLPNTLQMNLASPAIAYVAIGMMAIAIALIVSERAIARMPAWTWGTSAAVMLFVTIVAWADANAFIYFRF